MATWKARTRRVAGRTLRWAAWTAAYCTGLLALLLGGAWVWWQPEPQSRGTLVNGLWARHQWVGEPHTEEEYRALGRLLRENRITDVFFHAGPFEADGTVPPSKYRNARALVQAMRRHAPGVRAQAYLGQIRKLDGNGVKGAHPPGARRPPLPLPAPSHRGLPARGRRPRRPGRDHDLRRGAAHRVPRRMALRLAHRADAAADRRPDDRLPGNSHVPSDVRLG